MKIMNTGPYPVTVGLCLAASDWRRAVQKLGAPKERYPSSDGCVTSFRQTRTGAITMIVTFRPGMKDRTLCERVGIVAHEATHVWQNIMEHINEKRPGAETEACSVQWIVQWLCEQLEAEGWLGV